MAWFSNEAVCMSFFFEASSWLCHLDTCLTWLIRSEIFERLAKRSPSGDDAMLSVAARKERSCQDVIIPPHPTPPPRIWRRCYVDCGRKCDADVGFWVARMVVAESPFFGCEIVLFWLRNHLFLVAESSYFGCGIVLFWLRKPLFLVAEACLILVAESQKFGCGSVEIWFRNRNVFRTSWQALKIQACLMATHTKGRLLGTP